MNINLTNTLTHTVEMEIMVFQCNTHKQFSTAFGTFEYIAMELYLVCHRHDQSQTIWFFCGKCQFFNKENVYICKKL
jgi:hypothetical protein